MDKPKINPDDLVLYRINDEPTGDCPVCGAEACAFPWLADGYDGGYVDACAAHARDAVAEAIDEGDIVPAGERWPQEDK